MRDERKLLKVASRKRMGTILAIWLASKVKTRADQIEGILIFLYFLYLECCTAHVEPNFSSSGVHIIFRL
jgi:hypothetical protein